MVRSDPDIFSQAQSGNPEAIAALMNHSLQRKQVTVRAARRAGCLTILATSREGPDATFMANFVQRGLDRLQPRQVDRVVIRGYALGGVSSLWTAEYDPQQHAPPQISQPPRSSQPSQLGQLGQTQLSQTHLSQIPVSQTTSAMPTASALRSGLSRSTRPTSRIPKSSHPRSTRPKSNRPKSSREKSTRSRTSSKPSKQPRSRFTRWLLLGLAAIAFVALSVGTVLTAFYSKLFTAQVTEASIYQIQFLGDLLRGIEAAEVFNIFIFAILGLGLGLATLLVPREFGIRVNATIGLIALPVILSVSTVIRYNSWLDEFAQAETLTYEQTIAQTDIYLQSKVDRIGLLGFYLHTAKYPGLPTTQVQMSQIDTLEMQAANRLEAILAGLPFPLDLPKVFALCMWGIRVFYFLLSLLTAIGNFAQGVRWADRLGGRAGFQNNPNQDSSQSDMPADNLR